MGEMMTVRNYRANAVRRTDASGHRFEGRVMLRDVVGAEGAYLRTEYAAEEGGRFEWREYTPEMNAATTGPVLRNYWLSEERPVTEFKDELSRRRFPKALRPSHVYRADGAHIPYDKWFFSPDSTPIVGMMFEDGVTVGKVA